MGLAGSRARGEAASDTIAEGVTFSESSTQGASRPLVSFVVIAHNEAPNIERTLASILTQQVTEVREVIVVDDGSTDDTAAVVTAVARSSPDVRLVRLGQNQGRGFARRRGIAEAQGRFIATIDADIVLPADWLARCLQALESADAVAGTAVPDGDVAYLYSRFRLEPKLVGHTIGVTGSNAVYRREIFDLVSFDPSLRDGEDVALNHALRAQRARMLTVEGLTALHEETKTFAQAIGWMYQSGRGATRQLYRYREPRPPDLAFAGWLLAWAAVPVAGRRRRAFVSLPVVYVAAAATAHVRRSFAFEPRAAHRILAAVVTDIGMLNAYFCGRLVGLWKERS